MLRLLDRDQMIPPYCFQKPWLDEQSRALRLHPDGRLLLEKCLVVLELTARLSAYGLHFALKGGAGLVFQLTPVHRLSIDADILTAESLERVEAALHDVVRTPPFSGQATHQDWRDRESPRLRFFEVNYHSAVRGAADHVQLDVTLTSSVPLTTRCRIAEPWFHSAAPLEVNVLSVEELLGDKLAAFAPQTIGVRYRSFNQSGTSREREGLRMMKQLFDLHHLFAAAVDLGRVASAYQRAFDVQNRARGGHFTLQECLRDTVEAARELSLAPSGRTDVHTPHQRIFRRGHEGLKAYLVREPFSLDHHARMAAARAGLLATLIARNLTSTIAPPSLMASLTAHPLSSVHLAPENAALESLLRRTAPEALYLWSLIEKAERSECFTTPEVFSGRMR